MGMWILLPKSSDIERSKLSLLLLNRYIYIYVHVQAKPILDGKDYSQLLDPSLQDDNNGDQMERMVLAATLCIRHNPQSRPKMGMVSQFLILYFLATSIN